MSRMRRLTVVAGALVVASVVSGCALLGPVGWTSHAPLETAAPAGSPAPAAGPDSIGWTALPTAPDPSFLAAAMRICPGLAGRTLTRFVQDQRGPGGAAFVWTEGDTDFQCFVGRTDGRDHVQAISAGSGWPEGSPLQLTGTDCGPPTVVTGNSGPGTTAVTIQTVSGRTVTASVADGRFVAWWPGEDDSVSITGTDAGGSSVTLNESDRVCEGSMWAPSISPSP